MSKNNFQQDSIYLKRALELAQIRRGFCASNPSVGALIVDQDGTILSEGYHFGVGHSHAEVEALKNLKVPATGKTIYVTLEPCSHWGRTPPCVEAILQGGLSRVVYGYNDPNPIVSGKGAKFLTEASIRCDYVPLPEIQQFYQSYQHWHLHQIPFITAKIAMSLNGKIAGINGEEIQITGDSLKQLTHKARKTCDAILTTAKTINSDDPQLNSRIENETIAKPIYVLDRNLTLNLNAMIFRTAKSVVIFHSNNCSDSNINKLIKLGARCISLEEDERGLSLIQAIKHIGSEGVHDLWIEAGGKLLASFMEQKLLQCLWIYLSPKWIDGMPAFSDKFAFNLSEKKLSWEQYGNDVVAKIDLI